MQPQLQVGAEHMHSDPKGKFPRAAPRKGEGLDRARGRRRLFGGAALSQGTKLLQVTQHSCRQSSQLSGGTPGGPGMQAEVGTGELCSTSEGRHQHSPAFGVKKSGW